MADSCASTNILSASQIELFQTCPRKWGYRYIDGLKPKTSIAMDFGSKVHSWLESYLLGKQLTNTGRYSQVAQSGIHFLPQPGSLTTDEVERYIEFTRNGVPFRGYIDFLHYDQDLGTLLIGDHKTTSSFSRALTDETLSSNIQAAVYAFWGFQHFKPKQVKLQWVYYRTKGKAQARNVEATFDSPKPFEDTLVKIDESAKEIVRAQNKVTTALPRNYKSCFKYGRCEFWDKCRARKQLISLPTIPKEKPITKPEFDLYVDCMPIKSRYKNTVLVSDLIQPAVKKIMEDKKVPHYRLIAYGQHVGFISAYLRNELQSNPPPPNTAVLTNTKTPEGCDSLTTLTELASLVVQAT